MLALKTVRQGYTPNDDLLSLLEEFRHMLNECIRIGLRENLTNLKALSVKAYGHLSRYDAMSYKLCAISRAAGILRNYRKAGRRGRHVVLRILWKPSPTLGSAGILICVHTDPR